MLDKITNILNQRFESISLEEMDSVKLMDRADTKYIFPLYKLESILLGLSDRYKVLEVAGTRASRYETLYFDKSNLELYHKHQGKRSNRYKIRSRNYVESALKFLEVKLKNNKGRTVKKRVQIDNIVPEIETSDTQSDFLLNQTGFRPEQMKAQFWVNYNRITLVNLMEKVRCTIDLNLQFISDQITKDYSHIAILELKQEKNSNSGISEFMKKIGIRQGGLSKYCLGVISLHPTIKHNNFKSKLMFLNKIKQGDA